MSERRLSEIAKVLRQPEGIVGSEFTRINKAARKAGIRFDLWQQGFLWLLFAKNAEGKYACGADGAVLSSCRQIGKTFTVGTALFLKAILTPNLKAIWTAHHTRTSDETFADMCEMEHNPVLGRYVERIRRANGQQEITFTSGSRIMFGARENGFGRGLHSVDVAVFDEAQILTVRAMDNMIPVLNTSPNPLVVYMGNPPKPGDQCDAFTEKRMHALNHDGNLLYVELAADKDADSDDREQWAKANPSYPKRTSEQAIMRMRNNLSDDSFRREALGIWDETATAYAISPDLWQAAAVDDVPEGGTVSFGIDMPPDRSVLTIGAALRYADGSAIVQMANIKDARQAGTMWAVDMLAELCVFEGFVSPGVDDPFQLQDFMSRIGFTSVLQQAIQTALIHGCSFLSVIQDAENRPLIRTHTAESSAAIWDYPNRRVKACMAITDVNNDNEAIGLVLYMPTRNISVSRSLGTWYVQGSQPTVNGECSVFRLAYKATEVKPFGRSRISHDAMNIIDGANRTIVRAEANAEFYAFPKILLMGTSDELASLSADAALKLYMGRYNMISKDADGDSPTVTQLAASSMDPHLTMLKSWAAMFASAMNIPASSLGIVSDANPTSADATEAQREDLIIEARHCDRDFGESILQAARLVARIQDPSVSDDDLMKLQVDWKNPNTPSSSMSADAFSKLAGSIDSFANSEVGMTRAGLSRSEIVRLKADQRKAQAGQVLDQIRGMRQQTEQTQDDGERQTDASTQSTVAGGG